MEFGVGSIGLAALITSIGGKPEEVDGTVMILTAEYPNPEDYASIIRQAHGALGRYRSRTSTEEMTIDGLVDAELE
jgi:hypothetical protein